LFQNTRRFGNRRRKWSNDEQLQGCAQRGRKRSARSRLLACVEHTLGHDFKLSSLNARSARPRSYWMQPLHCDTGALPDEKGNSVCNVVWIVDDFTAETRAR
jgi:hypothetical protein